MQAIHEQNLPQLAQCISQQSVKTLEAVESLVEDVHYLLDAIEEPTKPVQTDQEATAHFKGKKPTAAQRALIQYLLQQHGVQLMAEKISLELCRKVAEAGEFNEIEVSREVLRLALFVDYLKGLADGRNYL